MPVGLPEVPCPVGEPVEPPEGWCDGGMPVGPPEGVSEWPGVEPGVDPLGPQPDALPLITIRGQVEPLKDVGVPAVTGWPPTVEPAVGLLVTVPCVRPVITTVPELLLPQPEELPLTTI